jgi:hypothetical protein
MSATTLPRRRIPLLILILAIFLLPVAARAALFAFSDSPRSWAAADWSSTRSLPPATEHEDARVIVFAGTAGAWKGVVAVHSWVVLKRENARAWTRYDVVGWGKPVRHNGWAPDGRWYGNNPVAIADLRGEDAERLIPRIEAAVRDYRYRNYGDYRVWPGPNSNSFTAAILRAVPELGVTLPSNAIGRDFRDGFYAGLTDSRTGLELNLWGYAGVKIGWVEGIEFNLLGLVAGIDVRNPAVKLPGFGRIGV